MTRPLLYLPLGEKPEPTGHLTFMPHWGSHSDTATFDVCAGPGNLRVGGVSFGPDYERRPDWHGVCCNITREQAELLREQLDAWLSVPLGNPRSAAEDQGELPLTDPWSSAPVSA